MERGGASVGLGQGNEEETAERKKEKRKKEEERKKGKETKEGKKMKRKYKIIFGFFFGFF